MSDDQEFMKELQREFLDEAVFLIDQCEESYLKLEDVSLRAEELAKIFRLAHSLKGAGTAVGFLDLAGFAHTVEDCLSLLRARSDMVNSEVISLLLECGDALKVRVFSLRSQSDQPWDVTILKDKVITKIKEISFLQSMNAPGPAPSEEPALQPNEPQIAKTPTPSTTPTAVQPQGRMSVKIDIDRIDSVLDIVGELVVIGSQLMTKVESYSEDLELAAVVALLDKTVRELQDKSLSMRMTPLKPLFQKAQRTIRDLAMQLGKSIDVEMSGEETEIDRTMVDLLADPLLHLVRNSIDHGIESTEKRKSAGKSEKGKIKVSSAQAGDRVIIAISDDGGGINREKVLKKAIENGVIQPNTDPTALKDEEVFNLIFSAGFSTADKVTDISGRGVGLDVVKTNIERMRGQISIKSKMGQGSEFIITLPLTTSITDGMWVSSSGSSFIVPIGQVRGLSEFTEKQITHLADGTKLIEEQGQLLPIYDLSKFTGDSHKSPANPPSKKRTAVIVQRTEGGFAIEVDQVLGQVQVVLKPLSDGFSKISGLTGAAIMGDGSVGLILNIEGLHYHFSRKHPTFKSENDAESLAA